MQCSKYSIWGKGLTMILPVTAAICDVPMATPLIREFPRGGELTKVKLSTSSTDLIQIPASVISSKQHLLYLKENQCSHGNTFN